MWADQRHRLYFNSRKSPPVNKAWTILVSVSGTSNGNTVGVGRHTFCTSHIKALVVPRRHSRGTGTNYPVQEVCPQKGGEGLNSEAVWCLKIRIYVLAGHIRFCNAMELFYSSQILIIRKQERKNGTR